MMNRRLFIAGLLASPLAAVGGFIKDFKTAQRFGGARSFLHRFTCYLEILLNHVGMRSVLAGVRQEMVA